MELKSEKSIKKYLEKLPDDTIIKYYLDVEYSPFPILIANSSCQKENQGIGLYGKKA
jgi:hypothetical protein